MPLHKNIMDGNYGLIYKFFVGGIAYLTGKAVGAGARKGVDELMKGKQEHAEHEYSYSQNSTNKKAYLDSLQSSSGFYYDPERDDYTNGCRALDYYKDKKNGEYYLERAIKNGDKRAKSRLEWHRIKEGEKEIKKMLDEPVILNDKIDYYCEGIFLIDEGETSFRGVKGMYYRRKGRHYVRKAARMGYEPALKYLKTGVIPLEDRINRSDW